MSRPDLISPSGKARLTTARPESTLGDPDADQARLDAALCSGSTVRWWEGGPIEGIEQRRRLVSGDGAGFEQAQDLEALFAQLVALGRANGDGDGFDHWVISFNWAGCVQSGTSRQDGGPLHRR